MTQMGHAKAGTPPSDTFEIHLTQQLTLTNLVNEAGLSASTFEILCKQL